MGRFCYEFSLLFKKYPPKAFFGENWSIALLNPVHVHIDNYGNYITGFCAGLSWEHITELPVLIKEGVNLSDRLVLKALLKDNKRTLLYRLRKFWKKCINSVSF